MALQLLNTFNILQESLEQFNEDLPAYITQNLNPKFEIRAYQKEALNRFEFYLNSYKKRIKPTQLLFQMATGSGKTLIMAGCILQLFKQGYRNFIFFVDSTSIIEKTKNNFLNSNSSKYLFNEEIQFEETKVSFKEVENFSNSDSDCINIHFSTIQGLHSRLNNPKENSITFDDFQDRNIVMLSDEAHHMNVDTLASTGKQLSIKEFDDYQSWESTALRIFRSSPDNILLEFTATAELHHDAIAKKYDDKLLYDYSLKNFYLAKYSKEVNVLQASLTTIDRALQAIILSQYRLLVFAQNNILIKPVVMFKSNCVTVPKKKDENKIVSSEFKAQLLNKLTNLKEEDILRIKDSAPEKGIIRTAFSFFESTGTSIENLVFQIKDAFSENKTISVDSLSDKQATQLVINSLEEANNAIRAVFAVDALNEGWDVLNLFDIVRLYNTRDAKNGTPGKTTMSEAQLIGRGARYCPFTINKDQPMYQRKFDEDLNNPLRICEELYFHSENNSRYIEELNTALDKIGIKPINVTKRLHALKEEFKETSFYKNGFIYLNQRHGYKNEDIFSFPQHIKDKVFYFKVKTGHSSEATLLQKEKIELQRDEMTPYIIDIATLGIPVVRKAMQKLPFYNFNRLSAFFPNIASISNFIVSKDYLSAFQIEISGRTNNINDLTQEEKLNCTLKILQELQPLIEKGKVDYKGSREFTPNRIKNIFEDREMNYVLRDDGDAETGYPMSNPKLEENYLDIGKEDWYVFKENYGTSEEKKLILFIKRAVEELKKRFKEVYLLRNEKYFQIYRMVDGKPFEPDFVLFLQQKLRSEKVIFQLFIEPKGQAYLEADKWKEEFLIEIENKYIIYQNNEYKLIGLPFYNSDPTMQRNFSIAFDRFL